MISYGVNQSSGEDKLQVMKQNGNLNHVVNNNNMKQHPLKRVSFGSSKGSMVETLIYDHPLPEEDGSYYEANITRFGGVVTQKKESETEHKRIDNQIRPPSKVRVTFFEAEKPTYVSSPESADCSLELDIPAMSTPSPNHDRNPGYIRQLSTDSGKDNPFRPDGDLSREADQIVEMIREGRPITLTPTPELPEHQLDGEAVIPLSDYEDQTSPLMVSDGHVSPPRKSAVAELQQQPPHTKTGANGNAPLTTTDSSPNAEPVEVHRGVAAPPQDASQIEHVVIKKKPKCKCCEIM